MTIIAALIDLLHMPKYNELIGRSSNNAGLAVSSWTVRYAAQQGTLFVRYFLSKLMASRFLLSRG